MLRPERAKERREKAGFPQATVAAIAEVAPPNYSCWERGGHGVLSREAIARVAPALRKLIAVRRRFKGVPIDMTDVPFLRRAIHELEREEEAAAVPQKYGAHFLRNFCELAGLKPHQFAACAQLAAKVVNASVVSDYGQAWILAWSQAVEVTLGQRPFSEFASKFPDEQAALEALANESFARIVKELRRERVLALLAGMLRAGELKAARTGLS